MGHEQDRIIVVSSGRPPRRGFARVSNNFRPTNIPDEILEQTEGRMTGGPTGALGRATWNTMRIASGLGLHVQSRLS